MAAATDVDGSPPSPSFSEMASEAAVVLACLTGETAKWLDYALVVIRDLIDQPAS